MTSAHLDAAEMTLRAEMLRRASDAARRARPQRGRPPRSWSGYGALLAAGCSEVEADRRAEAVLAATLDDLDDLAADAFVAATRMLADVARARRSSNV